MVKQDGFKKGTLTCTIDTTYGISEGTCVPQCPHISPPADQLQCPPNVFGHKTQTPPFFLQLSSLSGHTVQVHNLFKCHIPQL